MKKKFFDCVGKVRKSLTMLGLVLCCAMTASVFTSCGSDDDPAGSADGSGSGSGSGTDTTVAAMKITPEYTASEDLLKYCDVKIEYTDDAGAKTESVTNTSWKKTLQAKVPATITVKSTVTLKTDIDISSVETDLDCALAYSAKYDFLNASGNSLDLSATLPQWDKSFTGPGKGIAENIKKGKLNITMTYSIDKNGELTATMQNGDNKPTTTTFRIRR